MDTRLDDHIQEANRRFASIEGKLDRISGNELVHIKADLDSVKERCVKSGADLEWIKKGVLLIAAPTLGAVGLGIANLMK